MSSLAGSTSLRQTTPLFVKSLLLGCLGVERVHPNQVLVGWLQHTRASTQAHVLISICSRTYVVLGGYALPLFWGVLAHIDLS